MSLRLARERKPEKLRDAASMTSLFAEPRLVTNLDDCLFYHSMDIPGHGSVEGYWDLRGRESQYLGGASFAGKRVLEVGPASGHITFFMETSGAEVISIEAGEDYPWEFCWDIPDAAPAELAEKLSSHRAMMERIKNSYWFCHRRFSSKAKVHYGSAYSIPQALGKFDVSVLACVLLHNKNPLQILESCARLTNETVVVVEPFRETQLAQSPAVFLPSADESLWHTWWSFSPVYFIDILRSMGFRYSRVTFHQQQCFGEAADLFTIVASRNRSSGTADDEVLISAELSSPIERLNVGADQLMHVPVSIVNRSAVPLSSSGEQPVLLSYHWRVESGETIVWDGLRTFLPRPLFEGDRENLLLMARAPTEPGSYFLEITMIKELVMWCDDKVPGLPLRIKASVTR